MNLDCLEVVYEVNYSSFVMC